MSDRVLRKLVVQTISDALRGMEVGEICQAPDNVLPSSVATACAELKAEGCLFSTTSKPGVQIITRLK